jgi:hypothetical protein
VRTDKDGRFRANHFRAERYGIDTGRLEGEPYFAINHLDVNWPRGQLKHSVEVALPRGVLQSGKVLDDAGRPVADANVQYLPQLFNNPALKGKDPDELWVRQIGRAKTRADGSFQIPVMPGPGHLTVNAWWRQPFVSHVRTRHEVFGHDRLGGFWAANAFVKLDVPADGKAADVTATLQRARPLRGRLVDADGKPVATGQFAARTLTADLHRETGLPAEHVDRGTSIPVKDGRFEFLECSPTDTYRAFVLDEANRRAGTFRLEGKHDENRPLTVRWKECGSATARLVDAKGDAVGNYPVLVWVTEALPPDKAGGQAMRTTAPFGDSAVSNKNGRITLNNLIPGVRYMLLQSHGKQVKEFTVEPGERIDLGDVVVDPTK